jgi:hypothetical protein
LSPDLLGALNSRILKPNPAWEKLRRLDEERFRKRFDLLHPDDLGYACGSN